MSAAGGDGWPAAVRVKEEKFDEIEIEIEYAGSEAAAANLYAEHGVKPVLNLEQLQPPLPSAVYLKEEHQWVGNEIKMEMDECGASECAASLYDEHEVKRELVLGPERQDITCDVSQSSHCAEWCSVKQEPAPAAGSPGDAPRSGKSCGEQLALRTCSDSLQRIPLDNELHKQETSSNIIQLQIPFEDSKRKEHVCGFCEKRFTRLSHLTSHEVVHTGEKPYKCEICDKKFARTSSLTTHILTHTKEKPFSCNICNKQFSQSSNLASHKKIHTGKKPFLCNICNKQFLRKADLISHNRIHTEEKLFSCNICEKQFRHGCALAQHKIIHTGEKPFSCDVCKKQFTQRPNLARHILTHARDSKTKRQTKQIN